ncbi:hypothetical protein C7G41_36060 [Bradyrhizobium sp. MOS002]|nr:hypothetical protein C7G41_36060 [Bradyrhizobium sp. MOS002]
MIDNGSNERRSCPFGFGPIESNFALNYCRYLEESEKQIRGIPTPHFKKEREIETVTDLFREGLPALLGCTIKL